MSVVRGVPAQGGANKSGGGSHRTPLESPGGCSPPPHETAPGGNYIILNKITNLHMN